MSAEWPLWDGTGGAALLSGDICRWAGCLVIELHDSARGGATAARDSIADCVRSLHESTQNCVHAADALDFRPSLSLLVAVRDADQIAQELLDCIRPGDDDIATARQVAIDAATRDHALSLHHAVTAMRPGGLAGAMAIWAGYCGHELPAARFTAKVTDITAARRHRGGHPTTEGPRSA